MESFTKENLEAYMNDDYICALLECSQSSAHMFTTHQWLCESIPKRMIYDVMYGDLLKGTDRYKSILDVGGGLSVLTRHLLDNYKYTLLDILAHDDHVKARKYGRDNRSFWINRDWIDFDLSPGFDLVIANDIFPNVDQRLEYFLEKYIPAANEIRVLLTYHNSPKWYKVKRFDGDEVFHMKAWDGDQLIRVLEKFKNWIVNPDFSQLLSNRQSLFANGRQVCMVTFKQKKID